MTISHLGTNRSSNYTIVIELFTL